MAPTDKKKSSTDNQSGVTPTSPYRRGHPNPTQKHTMTHTYIDFVLEVTSQYKHPNNADGWRFGQAVYNRLNQLRPDIAKQITGTPLDPYYKNAVTTETWEFIHKNW